MTEEQETQTLVRICVDLDEKIHIELKKRAAEERKPMVVIIRDLIIDFLKK